MKNSANGVQIYKVLMMMYSSTDQLQGPLIQSLEYSPPLPLPTQRHDFSSTILFKHVYYI